MSNSSIFVMSAPAGTGKTTIASMLTSELPFLERAITTTTRLPRVGEKDGVDYHFVSEGQFHEMETKDAFLETVSLYGYWYGTTKAAVQAVLDKGKSVLLVIDTNGAKRVISLLPEAILIFIKPPSIRELTKRLIGRKSEDADSIRRRVEQATKELQDEPLFQYSVINDTLLRAYHEVKSIIIERQKGEKYEAKDEI